MAEIIQQPIVLKLDAEEARWLLALTGKVTGHGDWRETNSRIYDALAGAVYGSESFEAIRLPSGVKL